MNKNEIMKTIQGVFDGLKDGEIIDKNIQVTEETVLIGKGAALDSIAFVTFFMELEDNLTQKKGEEIYLILDDILDLNSETGLTIDKLGEYIMQLVN